MSYWGTKSRRNFLERLKRNVDIFIRTKKYLTLNFIFVHLCYFEKKQLYLYTSSFFYIDSTYHFFRSGFSSVTA